MKFTFSSLQEYSFLIFIFLSYLLVSLSILKLSTNADKYSLILDYYVKIYICLYLIIKFNPFVKTEFTNHDRRVAFSSGLFLLSTTVIYKLLMNFSKINLFFFKKHE
jgi:hypothetical protein